MSMVRVEDVPAELLAAAKTAFKNAYAPYSKFHVGAALRADNGQVFAGANVENASYGLGRCAEQSAIQAMASAGLRSFDEVVVYTESTPAASPCGACRQVLTEFNPDAIVYMVNHQNDVLKLSVKELFPYAFELTPDA